MVKSILIMVFLTMFVFAGVVKTAEVIEKVILLRTMRKERQAWKKLVIQSMKREQKRLHLEKVFNVSKDFENCDIDRRFFIR